MKHNAISECQAIQVEADNYASDVLADLDCKLQEMLTIVQNGRQQLDS